MAFFSSDSLVWEVPKPWDRAREMSRHILVHRPVKIEILPSRIILRLQTRLQDGVDDVGITAVRIQSIPGIVEFDKDYTPQ